MTENGKYKKECAHLSDRQRAIYHNLELFIMGDRIDDVDFIDAMMAVQALANTMSITYGVWKSRQH